MNSIKIKFGNHLCDDFVILSSDAQTCRTKEQVEAVIKLIQEDKDILFFSSHIVPDVEEVRVPMVTGLAKLPLAFESWAVNTFPELNEQGTL